MASCVLLFGTLLASFGSLGQSTQAHHVAQSLPKSALLATFDGSGLEGIVGQLEASDAHSEGGAVKDRPEAALALDGSRNKKESDDKPQSKSYLQDEERGTQKKRGKGGKGGKKKKQDDQEKKQDTTPLIMGVLAAVKIAILLLFALLYKSRVVDTIPKLLPQEANSGGKDFTPGLFACFSNPHLCLHVVFCAGFRAAHTWTVANAMDFWYGLLLQMCCAPFLPCIGGLWLRPKVRTTLGLEADGCMDFVKWCCCTPCAVGQEAMQVDEESGVAVKCCFIVEKLEVEEEPLIEAAEVSNSPEPEP